MFSKETKRSIRSLSPDEERLWDTVTALVCPLKKQSHHLISQDLSDNRATSTSSGSLRKNTIFQAEGPEAKSAPRRKGPKFRVDARLDLHGLTQAEAYALLKVTLARESSKGSSLLLLITGKGSKPYESTETIGVLRRQVPFWLSTFEEVARIEPAHPRHGGTGALYVYIKKH
jgi:DNA-nicking Smr family endonuclease